MKRHGVRGMWDPGVYHVDLGHDLVNLVVRES
jgi:hypothetical protein